MVWNIEVGAGPPIRTGPLHLTPRIIRKLDVYFTRWYTMSNILISLPCIVLYISYVN